MTVYAPAEIREIPKLDLLTLLFESDWCEAKEDTVLHAEAADPSRCITKAEARSFTKRIAHGLRTKFDIGKTSRGEDFVVAFCPGQAFLPMLFYGVIAAGGAYSAASIAYTAPELVRQINQGKGKVLVCSPETKDVALEAAKQCGLPKRNVLQLESSPDWVLKSVETGESVISDQELDWHRITDPQELAYSIICILYSSGTTGPPKGVRISHENVVSQCILNTSMKWSYINTLKKSGKPAFEFRTIGHLPTAHVAAVQWYFSTPMYSGGTVYWMPRFDFAKFIKYNRDLRITFFFSVPPIFLLIAKSKEITDHFDNLIVAVSGAAPLDKELQALASSKFGKGRTFIGQTWGLSETTGSITGLPWDEKDDTGSVGYLYPNNYARLIDDDGNDVSPRGTGEVLMKGPLVTKGYYKNQEATDAAFRGEWFCTGDIGQIDAAGKIYVVDRKKELIKYKGLQVAPAELEALLLTHERIADAAVIGVPDPDPDQPGNEVPRAYVVVDSKVSESQIHEYVKARAASYKRLRGGIVFVEEVPKTPSGKILRKELRARAEKEGKTTL